MTTLKVRFYHTRFCPRCLLVARELRRQRQIRPELVIEEIEVAHNFISAWREGIRCIPALRLGEKTLSGLWLTPAEIEEFLAPAENREL